MTETTTIHSLHPLLDEFRIEVPDGQLSDLRRRLTDVRLPDPLPDDTWATGIPHSTLRNLLTQWADHDWRTTERRLNALPHVITQIDGQDIHAVHARSAEPDARPLMLLHGWPGSFLEFEGLIGALADPVAHGGTSDDAFHVIIPSLPGFGFSTPLTSAGWTNRRMAEVMAELMTRLGYERFLVQGGDVGAGVAPEIGRIAPERVIGIHLNGAPELAMEVDDETQQKLTPLELDRVRRIRGFMEAEFGYIAIQGTRPGLIGQLLTDSPAAQFAWIYDKLQAWTHPEESAAIDVLGPEFVFANASLYWFTASAGSAAFVGYAQETEWGAAPEKSDVPTAAIQFAHDVGLRHAAEASHRIVRWTDVEDRGGHFAALEEPDVLVDDLRAFARQVAEHKPTSSGEE